MLQEVRRTRQIPGEPFRRWFTDEAFDLIVWYAPEGDIEGFQLCYRADPNDEKALTWLRARGFSHNRIDDGEGPVARSKMTPILVPDGRFDAPRVLRLFEEHSATMDAEVARFVVQTIRAARVDADVSRTR